MVPLVFHSSSSGRMGGARGRSRGVTPTFSGYEKRARHAVDRFSHRPLPLKRIYLISEGPAPEIKPLQPQEAIIQLINQSCSSCPPINPRPARTSLQCTSLIKVRPSIASSGPTLTNAICDSTVDRKALTDDIHLAKV